jgi:radical SAM protein with 4Fe4S-binding SPASM domain
VATNGILLTPALARELFLAGVRHFDVGLETDFREATPGIVAAAASGAGVTVSFCVTAASAGKASEAVRLAAVLGAGAVCLNRFALTGRESDREYLPSPEELRAAFCMAGAEGRRLSVPVIAGIPLEPCLFPDAGSWGIINTGCRCGGYKWAVGPDGTLRTCEQNPRSLGSLLKNDFKELACLSGVNAFHAARIRPGCSECPHLPGCGGGCGFTIPRA